MDAFAIWTFTGRKYFPSGFYLFFDFLPMQVILAGLVAIGVAVYRWIAHGLPRDIAQYGF